MRGLFLPAARGLRARHHRRPRLTVGMRATGAARSCFSTPPRTNRHPQLPGWNRSGVLHRPGLACITGACSPAPLRAHSTSSSRPATARLSAATRLWLRRARLALRAEAATRTSDVGQVPDRKDGGSSGIAERASRHDRCRPRRGHLCSVRLPAGRPGLRCTCGHRGHRHRHDNGQVRASSARQPAVQHRGSRRLRRAPSMSKPPGKPLGAERGGQGCDLTPGHGSQLATVGRAGPRCRRHRHTDQRPIRSRPVPPAGRGPTAAAPPAPTADRRISGCHRYHTINGYTDASPPRAAISSCRGGAHKQSQYG